MASTSIQNEHIEIDPKNELDSQQEATVLEPTNTFVISEDTIITRTAHRDFKRIKIGDFVCEASEAVSGLLEHIGNLPTNTCVQIEITIIEDMTNL